ncbi:unnamed protein product [Acanthosepion pharaonis]|uniref:Uncharacterized protein n=1 Tax=Acanthosepion pharaonis TaxID=158019 RepID=A0A812D672_ACAPH|nr:unnamed protein product [Sepia pharaonis]
MVGNRAMYFSDVIMRSDNGHEYKEFHDLKGHKFAYSEPYSMSGAYIVLDELKNQKTNSSFFGDIFQSGSHLKSIQMVLKKQVDAAAIDSRVLKYFLDRNPRHERELTVLTSLGPMPTYPIVFRKNLPAAMKTSIVKALLAMPKNPKWASKLRELICFICTAPLIPFALKGGGLWLLSSIFKTEIRLLPLLNASMKSFDKSNIELSVKMFTFLVNIFSSFFHFP